jgi:hypothetical protein
MSHQFVERRFRDVVQGEDVEHHRVHQRIMIGHVVLRQHVVERKIEHIRDAIVWDIKGSRRRTDQHHESFHRVIGDRRTIGVTRTCVRQTFDQGLGSFVRSFIVMFYIIGQTMGNTQGRCQDLYV